MTAVRDRVPAEHHELGAGVVKLDEVMSASERCNRVF